MHCDFPNKAKGQPDSNPEVGEKQLHRRFEVKGEDSKWSYLSWSGRGANESNSLAATRPPKAKSASILPVRGVRGLEVGVVRDSWTCRSLLAYDLPLVLGFVPHARVLITTATRLRHTPLAPVKKMADSGIGIPISTVKLHKPYFTPQQVQDLCEKTRGKLSISQEDKARRHACTFIEAVGAKIGL